MPAIEDGLSNDSNLKENRQETEGNKEKSTSFNPFGKYQNSVEALKEGFDPNVQNLIKSFDHEAPENPALFLKRRPETTKITVNIKKLSDMLRSMAKSNSAAIPCTLSLFAKPFITLVQVFDKYLSNARSGDIMLMSQTIAEVVNVVANTAPEPFTSELLEEWEPLLVVLMSSKVTALRNCSINLWKNTFGKVKGKLRYPDGKLRTLLESFQAKHKITIPDNEAVSPIKARAHLFSDDEDEKAMDGIEIGGVSKVGPTDFAAPKSGSSFQESMSFELSQQPNFDNLAHQIIVEKQKEESSSVKKRLRGRPSKVSVEKTMLDENTSDFVVIKTPKSDKKSKLTERQKEKFKESRDGINYVNEESQSGTQRENAIKNALTSFNFDVGNDSVSTSDVAMKNDIDEKKGKKTSVEEEKKITPRSEEKEENVSKRTSLKRNRQLFVSDPATTLPGSSPKKSKKTRSKEKINLEANDNSLDKLDDDTLMTLATLDECRVIENCEKLNISADEEKKSALPFLPKSDERGDLVYEELKNKEISQTAKSGNQPEKQLTPEKVVRSLRSNRLTRKSSSFSLLSPDTISTKKWDEERDKRMEEELLREEERLLEEEERFRNSAKNGEEDEEDQTDEVPSTPSSRKSVDMATTPSILRKTPVAGTPLTERKRNRVHFDAEPVPLSDRVKKKVSCSPAIRTPIMPIVEEATPIVETEDYSDFPSNMFDPQSVILYPSLHGCKESVDVLIRKLVPLSGAYSSISILKKALSISGIKTVGQFADLTVKQVSKLNGIRQNREKTARKVLADYDANNKKLMKIANGMRQEEATVETVPETEKQAQKQEKPKQDSQKIDAVAEKEKADENLDVVEVLVSEPQQPTNEKSVDLVEVVTPIDSEASANKICNVKTLSPDVESAKEDGVVVAPVATPSHFPEGMVQSPERENEVLQKFGYDELVQAEAERNRRAFIDLSDFITPPSMAFRCKVEDTGVTVQDPIHEAPNKTSEMLKDIEELDTVVHRLARKVCENQITKENLEVITDKLFRIYVSFKGLNEVVREKGLNH